MSLPYKMICTVYKLHALKQGGGNHEADEVLTLAVWPGFVLAWPAGLHHLAPP